MSADISGSLLCGLLTVFVLSLFNNPAETLFVFAAGIAIYLVL